MRESWVWGGGQFYYPKSKKIWVNLVTGRGGNLFGVVLRICF